MRHTSRQHEHQALLLLPYSFKQHSQPYITILQRHLLRSCRREVGSTPQPWVILASDFIYLPSLQHGCCRSSDIILLLSHCFAAHCRINTKDLEYPCLCTRCRPPSLVSKSDTVPQISSTLPSFRRYDSAHLRHFSSFIINTVILQRKRQHCYQPPARHNSSRQSITHSHPALIELPPIPSKHALTTSHITTITNNTQNGIPRAPQSPPRTHGRELRRLQGLATKCKADHDTLNGQYNWVFR